MDILNFSTRCSRYTKYANLASSIDFSYERSVYLQRHSGRILGIINTAVSFGRTCKYREDDEVTDRQIAALCNTIYKLLLLHSQ